MEYNTRHLLPRLQTLLDGILQLLVLTKNFSTEATEFVTECDEYEWNGEVFIQITMLKVKTIWMLTTTQYLLSRKPLPTEVITACDSFEWNGEVYTESGTYTYETTTELGCPWIQTLELTINSSSESLTIVEECNEYYWNGINYNTSGEYIFMTTNAVGCDSIAVLDLTINYSPVVPVIEMTFSATLEVTNISYDSYTWSLRFRLKER